MPGVKESKKTRRLFRWHLELLANLLLCEPLGVALEVSHALIHRHVDLLLANGNQALCQMVVVLGDQAEGDDVVVDVVEDQRLLSCVFGLGLHKVDGVFTPVTHGVEVMGRVVPVVVAVSVALKGGNKTS